MTTKREVEAWFVKYVLPSVRTRYEADGVPDYPARSEAWNEYTDGLCKDGEITGAQYSRWSAPRCCARKVNR